MLKKIEFVSDLSSALRTGLVLLLDNEGHRFVTTNPELADAEIMGQVEGSDHFVANRDQVVWNLLDAKPEVIQPLLFTGLLYDMGVNRPAKGALNNGPIITSENYNTATFYRDGTADKAEFMTLMASNDCPYLFKLSSENGDYAAQVDDHGQDKEGRRLISALPTYDEEEVNREMTGYLVLSRKEGPVFVSQPLMMGDLPVKTPGIDLSDGSMMVPAIQHVHRDHGVIGYAFTA